jgi:membrane-bound metal-dependent hydrolase YbcI (DUF457 family)
MGKVVVTGYSNGLRKIPLTHKKGALPMFVGHIALGLAAKRAAPQTSVATLVAASYLPDLIWPILLLTGIESARIVPGFTAYSAVEHTHFPWTHSLLMACVGALAFGLLYRLNTGDRRGALITTALVLSHWILDAICVPGLPLAPGLATKVGLGLWHSRAGTVLVEATLFAAGVFLYLGVTRASRKRGVVAFWAFVLFLVLSFLGNLGAPPPNTTALAVAVLVGWIFLPWLTWIERNRQLVGAAPPSS